MYPNDTMPHMVEKQHLMLKLDIREKMSRINNEENALEYLMDKIKEGIQIILLIRIGKIATIQV